MQGPEVRAGEILARVGQVAIGAEIGVFTGSLSALLLRALPALTLFMVDDWAPADARPQAYKDCGDWHAQLPQSRQESYCRAAIAAVKFAGPRAQICRMQSLAAACTFDAGTLDFVFIDADHSYEGCKADIRAWAPLVRLGGVLCGHDYDHPLKTGFGVKRAVDEAVAANGWRLELGADMTWFVRIA